jgi:hypothetical protein
VALSALALVQVGCTPQNAAPNPDITLVSGAEAECERSLQELADLILAESSHPSSPLGAEAIEEARELRAAAAELYLDGLYELALQLIDEAFALLRGGP